MQWTAQAENDSEMPSEKVGGEDKAAEAAQKEIEGE